MKASSRKVVTRAPARTVRTLNLRCVLPEPVEAESSLEADFVRQVALSPITKSVQSQPFKLSVSPKGYTPDYLVTTVGRVRAAVEVKLARKVGSNSDLFDAAAALLHERNFLFFVATEQTIRAQRRHERALLILRYAKAVYPSTDKQRAIDIVTASATGLTIAATVEKAKVSRELIFHLIGTRLLTTDPQLSLDDGATLKAITDPEMNNEDRLARWLGLAPWRCDVRGGSPG